MWQMDHIDGWKESEEKRKIGMKDPEAETGWMWLFPGKTHCKPNETESRNVLLSFPCLLIWRKRRQANQLDKVHCEWRREEKSLWICIWQSNWFTFSLLHRAKRKKTRKKEREWNKNILLVIRHRLDQTFHATNNNNSLWDDDDTPKDTMASSQQQRSQTREWRKGWLLLLPSLVILLHSIAFHTDFFFFHVLNGNSINPVSHSTSCESFCSFSMFFFLPLHSHDHHHLSWKTLPL